MGDSLAARYPLPDARTVQDLEREMNLQLARFSWGFVQLQLQEAESWQSALELNDGNTLHYRY